MLNNLLIYRLIVLNAVGAAFLIWAGSMGYIETLIDGDVTGILYGMVALFVVGMVSLFLRAKKVSTGLNELKTITVSGKRINANKFVEKGEHLTDISNWLVTLGLIGNVCGFAIALHNVDVGLLKSADGLITIAAQMMSGMRVAFYTTLVGGALGLWLDVNRRVLRTATISYLEDNAAALVSARG